MAKQNSLVKLEGTIGDISFYKTKDGFMARAKGGISKKRLDVYSSTEPVFQITKLIYTGVRAGYCFNNEGVLHLKGDYDAQLIDKSRNPIHTDWSGLRSEIFIGIRFKKNV